MWVLVAEQELPLGAHLGAPRRGYLHHGGYVGGGSVVHYAGFVHGLHRGPVEEIDLGRFREVIHRARSRIGESRYRLLTNSCEHFCEWCLKDEQRVVTRDGSAPRTCREELSASALSGQGHV